MFHKSFPKAVVNLEIENEITSKCEDYKIYKQGHVVHFYYSTVLGCACSYLVPCWITT